MVAQVGVVVVLESMKELFDKNEQLNTRGVGSSIILLDN